MRIILFLIAAGFSTAAFSQRLVFDPRHYAAVQEDGAARLAAENTHNNYLGNINDRLSDINVNLSSVVLVQNMIYGSLSQVNQVLNNGLALQRIYGLTQEIVSESNQMLRLAASEPHLLLFAEDVATQMKSRGVKLVTEVSDFVLREGENILMDYQSRDLLLHKITLELQVMRALVFSMGRSMYWAKLRGILRSVNPFQGFINQDLHLAGDILFGIKHLRN